MFYLTITPCTSHHSSDAYQVKKITLSSQHSFSVRLDTVYFAENNKKSFSGYCSLLKLLFIGLITLFMGSELKIKNKKSWNAKCVKRGRETRKTNGPLESIKKWLSLYACILMSYTRRNSWKQELTLDKYRGQTMITAHKFCRINTKCHDS